MAASIPLEPILLGIQGERAVFHPSTMYPHLVIRDHPRIVVYRWPQGMMIYKDRMPVAKSGYYEPLVVKAIILEMLEELDAVNASA